MKKLFLLKVLVTALLVPVFLPGCVYVNLFDWETVTAGGVPETYEIKVGDYNAIRAEGLIEIHYYSAASDIVKFTVPPDVKKYYIVEVAGNELVVRSTRKVNYYGGITPVLTVSSPVLNRMTISGAGNFTTHDKIKGDSLSFILSGAGNGKAEMEVNNFYADISGVGHYDLSGKADSADLNLSGAGELNAFALQAREANVNLSGAGAIKVNCSGNLRINANGVGSVEYRGSPVLSLNRGGMVSIKQVN